MEKKQKNNKDKSNKPIKEDEQSGIWKDERFQHLVTDPRFKSLPKTQRKVKIDKRFEGMFTDEKFNIKQTVDKYGRKVKKSNAEDLKRFYELESGASSNEESNEEKEEIEQRVEQLAISSLQEGNTFSQTVKKVEPGVVTDSEKTESSDDEPDNRTLREKLVDPHIDYARGEGRLLTDSSDDESSENEEELQGAIDHEWGALDADADITEKSTNRLAVCNMDWDRIRASDLMMLFSSFLQPGGVIFSVNIYPSEFGAKRMAEENEKGPAELIGLEKEKEGDSIVLSESEEEASSNDGDSDIEEGDTYHMEKLRQYQLKRLRYYYAVIVCDRIETADKIYQECDGLEYESSATRIDLRYIPDVVSFDDDTPSDTCVVLPDANSYKPRNFSTLALQHAKVKLTWDETELERQELSEILSSGNVSALTDQELRKIVVYTSEEESNSDTELNVDPLETGNDKKEKKDKEDAIAKYKSLLLEIEKEQQEEAEEKNRRYNMEFTWDVDEEETKKNKDEKDIDKDASNKPKADMMPIERVMLKRNEKNKERKQARKKKKLLGQGIDPDDMSSDSESDDYTPDGIDMNDSYFAEEFANGDFIDKKAEKQAKQKKKILEMAAEEEEKAAKETQLLELFFGDEEDDGKKHFSLEKIQKTEQETKSKRKRRKLLKSKSANEKKSTVEDNFQMDINDDRFNSIYSSHHFNIDPSDSHYKKTKGMEDLIREKLKRLYDKDNDSKTGAIDTENHSSNTDPAKRRRDEIENKLLVNNLKRKIGMKKEIK